MGYLIVGKYEPENERSGTKEVIVREYYRQGMIYKNEETYKNCPLCVCYIPELSDNKYTRNDFLELCDRNENLADELFDGCDWQHPESLLEDWIVNGEWEKCSECGTIFDCKNEDCCQNCGKPVYSDTPIYKESWYEEDLANALKVTGVPVTRENLNKFKDACKGIFDDKTARNEMLADKAYEIFQEVE